MKEAIKSRVSLLGKIKFFLVYIVEPAQLVVICLILFKLSFCLFSPELLYCMDHYQATIMELRGDVEYWQGDVLELKARLMESGLNNVPEQNLSKDDIERKRWYECAIGESSDNVSASIRKLSEFKQNNPVDYRNVQVVKRTFEAESSDTTGNKKR